MTCPQPVCFIKTGAPYKIDKYVTIYSHPVFIKENNINNLPVGNVVAPDCLDAKECKSIEVKYTIGDKTINVGEADFTGRIKLNKNLTSEQKDQAIKSLMHSMYNMRN